MSVLTLLIGIPGSGKPALAQQLIETENWAYLNTEELDHDLFGEAAATDKHAKHEAVLQAAKAQLTERMREGRKILLDGRLRLARDRRPYLEIARKWGYRTEAIFCNVPLEAALANNRNGTDGRTVSETALRRYERHLRIPTYAEGFSRIDVRTTEEVDVQAAAFFQKQEARLLADPAGLIREMEKDGSLALWLPELHRAIPVDQHNPHHQFTVYEHILKASETVAGTSLKMVWTLLLHDIGKAYPGIKQFTGVFLEAYDKWRKKDKVVIENGADIRDGRDSGEFYIVQGTKVPKELIRTDLAGHFYDHENLGAQMSFRILTRLGYPYDVALEVATLVQFHMMMPRDTERVDIKEIRWWLERVGPYAADLMLVRLADNRGK